MPKPSSLNLRDCATAFDPSSPTSREHLEESSLCR